MISFPFPGIPTTADGSEAVVWVETHITQGACAYPITPSTNMGGGYQLAVANGQKNLWGEPLAFLELESEHSSASTCEGFALAGGRVANFTSGQGLILMKEVLYVIAGKRLPVVFHIGARALTSQGLKHSRRPRRCHGRGGLRLGHAVCAQCSGGRRSGADRAPHRRRIRNAVLQHSRRFSHHAHDRKLALAELELMKQFVGDPNNGHRLRNLMDPAHPMMSGVVQNQDSYMKGKIAQRYFYDRIPSIMQRVMDEFYSLTGRRYGMIDSYALTDAEYAIVGLGSVIETASATAKYLREKNGVKVGTLHVTSFRPFPGPEIVDALKNVKALAVIERMDNPAAQSNPLTAEIKAAFADALSGAPGYPKIDRAPVIYSGSAGLGSRDVRPGDFVSVTEHLRSANQRRYFVLGIEHELALPAANEPDVRPKGAFSMRGHSIGGYGSVTTNKVIATIVGDLFGLQVQAYPMYGSEKKGLPTTYFLTVAEEPIGAHAELRHVDFVPLNNVNAFNLGNPLAGLVPGGTVFIQHQSRDPQQVWSTIPATARAFMCEHRIRVLALDAVKVAQEVSSQRELAQRMQGIVLLGVFLRVAPFVQERGLSDADVDATVEKSLRKFFGKRGETVVQENLAAVRRGRSEVLEIPPEVMVPAA